jgi:hypothetical protein
VFNLSAKKPEHQKNELSADARRTLEWRAHWRNSFVILAQAPNCSLQLNRNGVVSVEQSL